MRATTASSWPVIPPTPTTCCCAGSSTASVPGARTRFRRDTSDRLPRRTRPRDGHPAGRTPGVGLRSCGDCSMIHVQTQVEIERPIEDVFAYVSDPLTFPAWNSAVHSVRRAGPTTYVMERNLPSGPATNEIEVVARVPQREFVFRTTSGPTPFEYRIRFTPRGRATLVELDVTASLRP